MRPAIENWYTGGQLFIYMDFFKIAGQPIRPV